MAEIAAFRAVRYDPAKVGSLEAVTAPPYDVLSPDDQAALYEASPYNIVRIMLNRAEEGDNPELHPYERAAACLKEWLAGGIMVEDERPALYVYRQSFADPDTGERLRRTGFLCALKLEPYAAGVVLPHEETRTKARQDRLRLMRATDTNPEPIFGLFEDEAGQAQLCLERVAAAAPLMRVVHGTEEHEVWRVDEPGAIAHVAEQLRDRHVWIADGHHRYETGLAYRAERKDVLGDAAGASHILIALVPFSDPGMLVLPTHRLVRGIDAARIADLPERLTRRFDVQAVEPASLGRAMLPDGPGCHRFGLLTGDGAWVLTLRDLGRMAQVAPDHGEDWRNLDVSVLQALVLDESLGIRAADLATTPNIGYTRDRAEAEEGVRAGEWQAALLMNRPTADEVRRVALAGEKMPPKSTFFYPKLLSGLLLRRLGEPVG